MPTLHNQVLIHTRDQKGREATNFWTIYDQSNGVNAGLMALAEAYQGCSNALVTAVQLQTTCRYDGIAVAAPYPAITDVCMILGKLPNSYVRWEIHAPKAEIFQADGKTLNLANPLVTALTEQMLARLGTTDGHAVDKIIRGVRQWAGPRP